MRIKSIGILRAQFALQKRRYSFAAGFTFADLFQCQSSWTVYYLLTHAATIINCLKLSIMKEEQLKNLLKCHPDELVIILAKLEMTLTNKNQEQHLLPRFTKHKAATIVSNQGLFALKPIPANEKTNVERVNLLH